jgi:hypothetical protein
MLRILTGYVANYERPFWPSATKAPTSGAILSRTERTDHPESALAATASSDPIDNSAARHVVGCKFREAVFLSVFQGAHTIAHDGHQWVSQLAMVA